MFPENVTHFGRGVGGQGDFQMEKNAKLRVSRVSEVQLRHVKLGIITWVCTDSCAASDATVTSKAVCAWQAVRISFEPVASHQEVEGAAQSDYSPVPFFAATVHCTVCALHLYCRHVTRRTRTRRPTRNVVSMPQFGTQICIIDLL